MRLDIPLLRTKLVLECKDWCPTDIFLEATTARPTTSQEPWIRDEFQERVTRVYPTPPPVEDANDRGNAPGLERARDGRDDTTPAANGLGLRAMQLGGAGWHDNVDRSTEDGGDVKGGLGTGLRGPAAKERYVVMDSLTWQLKKIDTREEAMTLANNPGIDCGNEVWLFCKSCPKSSVPPRKTPRWCSPSILNLHACAIGSAVRTLTNFLSSQ
jgi:hypothetical protein